MNDDADAVRPWHRLKEEACIALTAFGYFSRLPIPSTLAFSEQRLTASSRYFPLVGWVVGGVGAAVFGLASLLHLPASIAILLSIAATLLLTGALHEDGFADCCDGFGGGQQREDVLRIMKDARIGAFGAIGVMLVLLLKWQTLSALAINGDSPRAYASLLPAGATPGLMTALWMIAAHAASRAGAIVYVRTLRYARADGKAKPFMQPSWRSTSVALLIGLPTLFWMDWRLGLLLIAIGLLLYRAMGRWFVRRIDGYTGDCLGLAQQVFEIAIYLTVLGWISF